MWWDVNWNPDAIATTFFWVVNGYFCPVASYCCLWVVFDAELVVAKNKRMFSILVNIGELVSLLSVCRVQVVLLVVVDLLVEVVEFTG